MSDRPVVRQREPAEWDSSVDVAVVGAGAGGLVSALAAAEAGATVVVLEKAADYGGTARKSGGGSWVPNNRFMRELGMVERREDVLRYMARTSRPTRYRPDAPNFGLPAWEFEQLEAFYDDAAATFEHLEAIGALDQFHLPDFPDYYAHLEEDVTNSGHLIVPRLPNGSPGDGPEMTRQLKAALDERGVPVLMEHRVTSAVVDDGDRVIGVVADTPAGPRRIGAERGVIFASGGFTHNKELCDSLLIGPIFGGGAVVTNEGDFIPIAQTLGAAMRNMNQFWGCPIIIEHALAKDTQGLGTHTLAGDSILFVNRYGVRAMNEKALYSEKIRAMFEWDSQRCEYPNLLMFAVWDQRTMDQCAGNPYDGGLIRGPGGGDEHVVRGETLEELARALDERLASLAEATGGVHLADDFAERLGETIERFNGFALSGRDEDFRRGEATIEQYFNGISLNTVGLEEGGARTVAELSVAGGSTATITVSNPTMYPLSLEGTYYAAILVPGTLDTKGGAMTDVAGRVLDHAGQPIEGVYAVGNCAASPSAQGYWGPGCTLGLIITQAWRTGPAAARAEVRAWR